MKEIHVGFYDIRLKKAFEKLKEGKYEDKELFKYINRAIKDLKKNPFCGVKIPKKLIPK